MIIVTGAAGFIGSCLISYLNKKSIYDIVAVDVLRENDKWKNLRQLTFTDYLDRSVLMDYLKESKKIESIIHIGACSATTEKDSSYLMENNYRYTLKLAQWAIKNSARFIYASSAATYGDGSKGYQDNENTLKDLLPLNMYGYSKHLFDLKAQQEKWFSKMCGLKFFNVYGPNEYHKDDMASVVFKAFNQINKTDKVKLFKSHRSDFKDGQQLRDFIYIQDVLDIIWFFMQNPQKNGLFNAGTGNARAFSDLAVATFNAMNMPVNIEYIDMPKSIRDRYQYFTEADISKLRKIGYDKSFTNLEKGISDYVQNYLSGGLKYY